MMCRATTLMSKLNRAGGWRSDPLSCADTIETREGDVLEIIADPFTTKLRNRLVRAAPENVVIRPL